MQLPSEFFRTDPVAYAVWKLLNHPVSPQKENHMNKFTYTARLIRIDAGDARFLFKGGEFRVSAGALVYLPPSTIYSTEFIAREYASLNLFFDFMPGRAGSEQFSVRYLSTIPHKSDADGVSEEPPRFTDAPEFSAPFTIPANEEITFGLHALYREFQAPDDLSPFCTGALTRSVLAGVLRQHRSTRTTHVSRTFARITEYVEAHLDSRLSGQQLSAALNYHPYYMNRVIMQYTGMSLHAYIVNEKIRRAKILLTETDMPLSEIAQSLAFCDASHFSRVFTAQAHRSPSAFRADARGI